MMAATVGTASLFLALALALLAPYAASGCGTIIPLYTYPTDSTWTTVAAGKVAYPSVSVLAAINPNSGPGSASNSDYVTGTTNLAKACVVVLGYVATTYGNKSFANVTAEIDKYVSWYPAVSGIFLDEMSNTAGKESYYTNITTYVKVTKGLKYTVGNPGADTLPSYVGTVDTIIIYENAGLPTLGFLGGWHDSYPIPRFAYIAYKVPTLNTTFVQLACRHAGFGYITNDTLPNPYDTIPPYFNPAFLAALE